jgi:hypothetical protein
MIEDKRIESTLKALTHAETPEGMEHRILLRLEAHQRKPAPIRRWLIPSAALGACAVVALLVATRHRAMPPAAIAPIVMAKSVAPLAPPTSAPQTIAHRERPAHKGIIAVSYPAPLAPLTEQEKLLVRLIQSRERTEAKQVATRADVPLTHEEKLLVAVSRIRQDAVLEALDPVRRAEADTRTKREFNAFVQEKDGGSE